MADEMATQAATQKLVDEAATQKRATSHRDAIPEANHFFEHDMPQLIGSMDKYQDMRLAPDSPIR